MTCRETSGSIYSIMVDKISGQVAYAVMSLGVSLVSARAIIRCPGRMLKYDVRQQRLRRRRLLRRPGKRQAITSVVCWTGPTVPMVTGSRRHDGCLALRLLSQATIQLAMEAPQVADIWRRSVRHDVEGHSR